MKNEKIYAIFALTLILLSGLGFAYAHWSDSVTVELDAYTGVLEMVLLDPDQEIYVWYEPDWLTEEEVLALGQPWSLKNVMDCDWDDLVDPVYPKTDQELGFEHPCDDPPMGYKDIKFHWYAAYPETGIRYVFKVHNIGTIPAHWTGAEITSITVDEGAGVIDVTDNPVPYGIDIKVKAFFDSYEYRLPLQEEPQIHPCEEIEIWVEIYANDDLEPCSYWEWALRLDFAQYNWDRVQAYDTLTGGNIIETTP